MACVTPTLCFTPSAQQFHVHDRVFKPDYVLNLPVAGAQTESITGGHCINCSIPVRPVTGVLVGLCRFGLIKWTRTGHRYPSFVECKTTTAGSPLPVHTRTWNFVAFDWYGRNWQHQIINAAPMLGMAGGLLREASAAGADVTILHGCASSHIFCMPTPACVSFVHLLCLCALTPLGMPTHVARTLRRGLFMNDAIRVRAPPPSTTLRYASIYGPDGMPDKVLQRPLPNLVMALPIPGEEEAVVTSLACRCLRRRRAEVVTEFTPPAPLVPPRHRCHSRRDT